jgi:hypothetical protein
MHVKKRSGMSIIATTMELSPHILNLTTNSERVKSDIQAQMGFTAQDKKISSFFYLSLCQK